MVILGVSLREQDFITAPFMENPPGVIGPYDYPLTQERLVRLRGLPLNHRLKSIKTILTID